MRGVQALSAPGTPVDGASKTCFTCGHEIGKINSTTAPTAAPVEGDVADQIPIVDWKEPDPAPRGGAAS